MRPGRHRTGERDLGRRSLRLLALAVVTLLLGSAVWSSGPAQSASNLDSAFGPTRNLWIDRDVLRSRPTSGSAWDRLSSDARGGWGSADISDQDSDHDVLTFAGALYAVRMNDTGMRNKVISAIEDAIGTESGGRTLALARNLTGYVLAADLVGYDTSQFRSWLSSVRTENLDGRTLKNTHEERANNWGTHAGAARIAADLFLGDTTDLAKAVRVFQGFLGDRSAYKGFSFGDSSWQANPSAPVPINPAGAVKNGINIDGALVDDVRRCGCSVQSPAPKENYQWEAMQGIVTQATLLHAAGYTDVWQRSDEALYRATRFLYEQANFPAESDDSFVTFLIDAGLGTDYSAGVRANMGKSMAYTDYTHPTGTTAITRSRIIASRPAISVTPFATDTMRYVPVDPARLFDTRTAESPSGGFAPGQTIEVQVTGRAGIPSSKVGAVVLNVTATNAVSAGYVTAWPKGEQRPPTSNVNVSRPGETVPNLVIIPVGDKGRINFYSLGALDLLADVSGYFVEDDDARAGRFVSVDPERAFDTRDSAEPSGPIGNRSSISVKLAGRHGIPSSGASVAVINVTAIGLNGPGFVTTYPHGGDFPLASSLNLNHAGDVRSNLVFAPIGSNGSVDFYAFAGAHLIGDVVGYFTDDSAKRTTAGMFVATNSVRHVDTRSGLPDKDARWIGAGREADYRIGGRANVPSSGVTAVLANLTATEAAGPGHVTIWKAGDSRPGTSTLNLDGPGATRSTATIVPLRSGKDVSVYSYDGTHAIIDVFGYFVD
jgi:hypothetical protein